MNYLSVCSGIEAASVAWHGLGWNPVGFSEIEPFPSAVLKERFPDVTNYGDMTKFKEWENVGTVDLLVGGTPCQSFSVAGLRKGLADPRGNLMLTFGAIAHHFKARWIVWENVPGVLSSNKGRDFGSFLGMLAECGYGFAYRVLDAQFFGVPQRRRRVFVVGCLGDWIAPAKVLFDSESLSGNPPPSREKGKEAAGNAGNGSAPGLSAGGVNPTGLINFTPYGTRLGAHQEGIASTLTVIDAKFAQCVCYGIPGNWIGRKPENDGNATTPMVDLSPCITGMDRPAVCYENHAQDSRIKDCGEISPTLSAKAGMGGGNLPIVMAHGQANAEIAEGLSTTLNCNHESPIIADSCQLRRLTPKEYERLQGFPDDWTKIPWRNKPAEQCPDGPRYKACGNSMAVPVMRWIGERIDKQEKEDNRHED
jgi:DNA (cytosine-5)-methyltransferase 1